jgi:large subunit ribosomal protein L6
MAEQTTITETVTIPDGITVSIDNDIITVKGEKGELSKHLSHPKITLKVSGTNINIEYAGSSKRKVRALAGTYKAHIKNMIKGVTNEFTYTMKTVFSHFPIKTKVEGNEFLIENFLGERSPRRALILDGVAVKVQGDEVKVTSIDKEKLGQTVANIERASKVTRRDIRVFQDGVYLIRKEG